MKAKEIAICGEVISWKKGYLTDILLLAHPRVRSFILGSSYNEMFSAQ